MCYVNNNLSKFSAKSIGENYVMNYTDFSDSDTSLYGIVSLADSPSGNAPDNNVGDFKILRLGTNNEKYNTLMLSSPRFDSLYIGKFWDGNWQGWKQCASTNDLNAKGFQKIFFNDTDADTIESLLKAKLKLIGQNYTGDGAYAITGGWKFKDYVFTFGQVIGDVIRACCITSVDVFIASGKISNDDVIEFQYRKLGREIKYKDFYVELSESNWTTSAAGLNYFNFSADIPNKEMVVSTEILNWSNAKSNVTCSFYDNSYLQFRSSNKTTWNGTVRVFYY